MNQTYDYKNFAVLYVDDESQTASNFKEYFSDIFDVEIATSGEEAWQIFSKNPDHFAIVMTDQRMPASSGVELLERVRAARPRVLRILATAYSDINAAIAAVNSGAIYKYVNKPWDPPTLEMTLKRGMEFYLVQRERDLLMREKLAALQRLMMTDRLLSLGIFAAGLNQHLRNSLTAVKTFLDLAPLQLQRENLDINNLRDPDYWKNFYSTAQTQMGKIVSLLQDIHNIPESSRVPLTDEFSLNEVVQISCDCQKEAFAKKQIALSLNLGENVSITGNRLLIQNGLQLLLADEAANLPQGGKLSITTSPATDETGRAGVKIEMNDYGAGLSVKTLNCLFDPFFVKKSEPAQYGLNLLTCFFIVYHHSGSMTMAQNGSDKASFHIFLPSLANLPNAREEQMFLERVFDMEKVWEKMLMES